MTEYRCITNQTPPNTVEFVNNEQAYNEIRLIAK
jgi:hypothetical protein